MSKFDQQDLKSSLDLVIWIYIYFKVFILYFKIYFENLKSIVQLLLMRVDKNLIYRISKGFYDLWFEINTNHQQDL